MTSNPMHSDYCTLFNHFFLPMGLALIRSLQRVQPDSTVYVLCLDDLTQQVLTQAFSRGVCVIPLAHVEEAFPELLAVKPTRSVGEYCWTLTPYILQYCFKAYNLPCVTYVDADLYFFRSPLPFLEELAAHDKDVLITEHAYAPQYDKTTTSGRFCVQFLCFRNTPDAREVLDWWTARCHEWCFDRHEEGKFGDQMYLNAWPQLFGHTVHVLLQPQYTLAPWNVRYYLSSKWYTKDGEKPVFYHFHGLRVWHPQDVVLFHSYRIGRKARPLYAEYVRALSEETPLLQQFGALPNILRPKGPVIQRLKGFIKQSLGVFGQGRLLQAKVVATKAGQA